MTSRQAARAVGGRDFGAESPRGRRLDQQRPYAGGYRGWQERGGYRARGSLAGRGNREGERDFRDKAGDEVSSWFGDEDAQRRREMDRNRGRGPKNYARSDERMKEDVSDRLTDDGFLDATHIECLVEHRQVTPSGIVDSVRQSTVPRISPKASRASPMCRTTCGCVGETPQGSTTAATAASRFGSGKAAGM